MNDDHVDLEQGPPEYSLADQMRLRRQSIRVLAVRTLLLTTVPFGVMVVLSIYFRLISLDTVISALFVTYAITAVLLLYAHLIWIDYNDETQYDNNCRLFTFLFYVLLFVAAYLPFCIFSIFLHDQSIYAMVIQVLLSIFAGFVMAMPMACLFHAMVLFAQWTIGGRTDPIEFGDNGTAVRYFSQVFACIITCMYIFELAIIPIAKTVIFWY